MPMAERPDGSIEIRILARSDWSVWRDWLVDHPASPFHTPAWLELQAAAFGGEPLCAGLFRGNVLADVIPIVVRRKGPFHIGSSPIHVGTPYGGPTGTAIDGEVGDRLVGLAKENRISFLDVHLDPRVGASGDPLVVEKHSTYVLDLGNGKESVFERFESRCRRAIRKAERLGVVVREMTTDDVPSYRKMAKETYAKSDQSPPLPTKFVEGVLTNPNLRSQTLSLVAHVDGESVAAGIFPWGGDTVYYVDGVSSRAGTQYAPNNLLHWTVIQRAIDLGLRRYDLVGASIRSIAFFKRSFGAQETTHLRIYWGTAAGKLGYGAQRILTRSKDRRRR